MRQEVNHGRHIRVALAVVLLAITAPAAVEAVDSPEAPASAVASASIPALTVRPALELGFVDVPHHTLQFGEDTDRFDYVTQGGQEILFPFQRLRIDVGIGERQRHHVSLLYQPLTFETVTQMEEPLTIDDETFTTGQVVDLVYGFDFWRGSYVYRFVDRTPWEVDAGISFQIRNASIRFQAQGGDPTDSEPSQNELVVSQDTGPVPVLRARSRYTFVSGYWLEAEADGFYASNAFINGADYPFTGWIWDAAVSAGARIHAMTEAYLTVRTIGGGAEGTSTDPRGTWTQSVAGGDERYTSNSIATVAITAGFRLLF
ncbi:MAG: hypothetical protein WD492_13655 [Alkalispirochaeta sp.]